MVTSILLLFQEALCISPEQLRLSPQSWSVAPIDVLNMTGLSGVEVHFGDTDFLNSVDALITVPVDTFLFVGVVRRVRVIIVASPEMELGGVVLAEVEFFIEDEVATLVMGSEVETLARILIESREKAYPENIRNNQLKPTKKRNFFARECGNQVVFIVKIKLAIIIHINE